MGQPHFYQCSNRDDGSDTSAYTFFPILVGDLVKEDEELKFTEGNCFKDLTFKYHINKDSDGAPSNITFYIIADKPRSMFCKDWFLIANTEIQHVETIFFHGEHTITFTNLNSDTMKDINLAGFKIFMFCEGYIDTFVSVLKTLELFLGGLGSNNSTSRFFNSHVPQYMVDANLEFLSETMNYNLEKRPTNFVYLNESEIHSGDFMAVMRLDGLDPLIMYGTGSHAGHSTMALWDGDELYIIESQDAWYWPKPDI